MQECLGAHSALMRVPVYFFAGMCFVFCVFCCVCVAVEYLGAHLSLACVSVWFLCVCVSLCVCILLCVRLVSENLSYVVKCVCSVLQCVAVCFNVCVLCVAECCNVCALCVAVCCSVCLLYVAV